MRRTLGRPFGMGVIALVLSACAAAVAGGDPAEAGDGQTGAAAGKADGTEVQLTCDGVSRSFEMEFETVYPKQFETKVIGILPPQATEVEVRLLARKSEIQYMSFNLWAPDHDLLDTGIDMDWSSGARTATFHGLQVTYRTSNVYPSSPLAPLKLEHLLQIAGTLDGPYKVEATFEYPEQVDVTYRCTMSDVPVTPPPPCQPRTCTTNDCGSLDDGCGGTVSCPPCGSGSLYGFPEGMKVAAIGTAVDTYDVSSNGQCHPIMRTTDPLNCGGWVAVSAQGSKTTVRAHVLTNYYWRYGWYEDQYDDPSTIPVGNSFWSGGIPIQLDANGRGNYKEVDIPSVCQANPACMANPANIEERRTWAVKASPGAITVNYTSERDPYGCHPSTETCGFTVLAP